jgi:hypothetical protein
VAGPFYFSTSSAGEVVDVWFSSDETAKLVFLKTAIAKAFHHTGGTELLQKLFKGEVPTSRSATTL